MTTSLKILALVHAHSLAHVSRPLEIAKILRAQGHIITFAGFGKYLEVPAMEGFPIAKLPGISVEKMTEAIQAGGMKVLYREDELRAWVKAEIDLYSELKPDLIISDNRITASTSAEIAGIKMVSIFNTHMTMYREIPFYSARRSFLNKWIAMGKIVDRIENYFEFLFWNYLVSRNMNRVRKQLGLKAKFAYKIDEGQLNLIPDLPEFNPVSSMPSNFHYVGPLTWQSPLPAPTCLDRLDKNKKTVYFTVGSESLEGLLSQLSDLFDSSYVQVIVATGGARLDANIKIPSNIFVEKYINAAAVLPFCDLVVCHGGNGTIYQALTYAVPILGIATHEEQYYCLKRVNDLGLGIGLRHSELKEKGVEILKESVQKILSSPTYKQNAQNFQVLIKTWKSAELAADKIMDFIGISKHDSNR